MTFIRSAAWLLMTVILIGCSTKGSRAPVHETAEAQKREAAAAATQTQREKDWRPKQYIVQKGDTLYGIAFNYGLDYRELAELNGIQNPKVIAIGQVIRLQPSKTDAVAHPVSAADALIKQQPKLVKYPYSDAAMAQIEKVQQERVPVTTTVSSELGPVLTDEEDCANAAGAASAARMPMARCDCRNAGVMAGSRRSKGTAPLTRR